MSLTRLVNEQGFVVLDGGLATELETRGADLKHSLWSAKLLLEDPQLLEQVNYDYLMAGADVITTASYQATIPGLMNAGLTGPQAEAMLRRSVLIAERARERFWSSEENRAGRVKPLVMASIGPYGAWLHDGSEYRGHYGLSRAELKRFHRERLAIFVDCKPDLIAFETFPSLVEAEAVAELTEAYRGLQFAISFTCSDERTLAEGQPFGEAVTLVEGSPQMVAVGVNCIAPGIVEPLIRIGRERTAKVLMAYPNSGESYAAGEWVKPQDAGVCSSFEAMVPGWFEAGARALGGCCRTGPDAIRGIRRTLAALTGGRALRTVTC